MHSLASVLAALEAQKGHNGINTLVLYDTYFESTKIVRGAKNYSINVIRPNEVGEGYVQYISGSEASNLMTSTCVNFTITYVLAGATIIPKMFSCKSKI